MEEIIEELIKKYQLQINQKITYAEFLEMYSQYDNLFSQNDFAKMLGLTKRQLKMIRLNSTAKARILKNRIRVIEKKEREEIIRILIDTEAICRYFRNFRKSFRNNP